MSVCAISFDFWRTLFRDANGVERQALRIKALIEATGLPEPRLNEALRVTWGRFNQHHVERQQTLGPDDAVRITLEQLGIDLPAATRESLAEAFATAILDYPPEPIEGALEAVQAAAARVPVGVISDSGVSPGSCLRVLLKRGGFLPFITALAFSDEVGVAKPQRPMFEACAQGLGVPLSGLLHIGDLETTDIAGARAVGARAALFTGDTPGVSTDTLAHYTFSRWSDFITALPDILNGPGK